MMYILHILLMHILTIASAQLVGNGNKNPPHFRYDYEL